jgi:hypothetical protein
MKQTQDTMDVTFTGKRIGNCAAATKIAARQRSS